MPTVVEAPTPSPLLLNSQGPSSNSTDVSTIPVSIPSPHPTADIDDPMVICAL